MRKKLFRDQAVERLQSPDQVGTLVRVVQPISWAALCMIALILGAGLTWGFLGNIPHQIQAPGILTHADGVRDIVCLGNGQISEVFVRVGDTVRRGQTVARIALPALKQRINDSRAEWEEAVKYYAHLSQFHEKHLTIQLDNLQTKQKNLTTAAQDLMERLAFLKEQTRREKSLESKGIFPLKEAEATREKYGLAKSELNNLRLASAAIPEEEESLRSLAKRELMEHRNHTNTLHRKTLALEAQFELESMIRSEFEGRVVEIKAPPGTSVTTGRSVMTVEPLDRKPVALFYVSLGEGKKIHPGMEIDVSPSTIKRDEYGSILGLVSSVSAYPSTREGMLQTLGGNEVLVEKLSGEEACLAVYADLLPDSETPSGYRWTSSAGPDASIGTGTLCSGVVTVERKRPITLLIPHLKRVLAL